MSGSTDMVTGRLPGAGDSTRKPSVQPESDEPQRMSAAAAHLGSVGTDFSDHLRLNPGHGNRPAAELTGADHIRPRMVPDGCPKMAGDRCRLGRGEARRAAEDCQCAGVVDLADDQRLRRRERADDRTDHANQGLPEADLQPLRTNACSG